jgi:hypothetical protein
VRDLVNVLEPAPLALDDGHQRPGVICLANESRFTATNFSEPLTAYSVGWKDPSGLQAILDALFPQVTVGRRFEFKAAANSNEFLSEADDIRAIGAPFKRVEFTGTSVNQKTLNKGLTTRLDRDEEGSLPGAEEAAVARLLARLLRNDLRRGYALVIAAANNTAKTWDTTALKDPDMDVLAVIDSGGDKRGIDANLVVYGFTAWTKRLTAHRAQTVAGGVASASILRPEELAGFLGVDRVVVAKERYQSAAATKAKALGAAYILTYFAQANQGKDDPSNVKRFVTPTESGLFRVYREEHAKWIDVSVEHYSNIVIASTLGIEMLTIS